MENKMTDNEIKKALECCISEKRCHEAECPLEKACPNDLYALEKHALDLINRLEAENDWLKNELIDRNNNFLKVKTQLLNVQAEIERLKEIEYMYNDLCK